MSGLCLGQLQGTCQKLLSVVMGYPRSPSQHGNLGKQNTFSNMPPQRQSEEGMLDSQVRAMSCNFSFSAQQVDPMSATTGKLHPRQAARCARNTLETRLAQNDPQTNNHNMGRGGPGIRPKGLFFLLFVDFPLEPPPKRLSSKSGTPVYIFPMI